MPKGVKTWWTMLTDQEDQEEGWDSIPLLSVKLNKKQDRGILAGDLRLGLELS